MTTIGDDMSGKAWKRAAAFTLAIIGSAAITWAQDTPRSSPETTLRPEEPAQANSPGDQVALTSDRLELDLRGELKRLSQRIDDFDKQISANRSLVEGNNAHLDQILSLLGLLLTFFCLGAATTGFFAYKNAGRHAQEQADEWLKANANPLLAKTEHDLRSAIEPMIRDMIAQGERAKENADAIEKIKNKVEQDISPKPSLSDKNEISAETICQSEMTAHPTIKEDYYNIESLNEENYSLDELRTLGLGAFSSENYSQAFSFFKRITQMTNLNKSDLIQAHLNMAASLVKLDRLEEASKTYEIIIHMLSNR
ncbi:hypothetical protein F11_09565 [Rhodospirillum rubrum F11]|nr:hypothetical protein F11_09565 [Rhodospirillum rubrum F11]